MANEEQIVTLLNEAITKLNQARSVYSDSDTNGYLEDFYDLEGSLCELCSQFEEGE